MSLTDYSIPYQISEAMRSISLKLHPDSEESENLRRVNSVFTEHASSLVRGDIHESFYILNKEYLWDKSKIKMLKLCPVFEILDQLMKHTPTESLLGCYALEDREKYDRSLIRLDNALKGAKKLANSEICSIFNKKPFCKGGGWVR